MSSAEVVAEIETLGDTVAGLFDVDRSGWSVVDHSTVLRALVDIHERIGAALLDATADWDGHEAWSVDGSLTPAQWLRANTTLSATDARQTVRSARLVRRNDALAKALAVGEITTGHVDALSRHVTPQRTDLFDRDADVLVDGARTLSVDDTNTMARRWAATPTTS
jgi:hypothetical protein